MVNIINNNLWSPVPWGFGCGGHHNCGGNNWLNNMFKYQFMFSMMNNMTNMFRSYATPPQQQQSYIPYYGAGGAVQPTYSPYYNMGLSLGGQPSYEDYLEQQQNARDYAELKASYGNEFKFTSLGGEYQATLKSDRTVRFSASTPLELMEKMNAYIDQHPSEFRTQPTVVTPADDVTDVSVEEEHAAGGEQALAGHGTRMPQIEGYTWKKWANLSSTIQKQINVGTKITEVLNAVGINKPTDNMIYAMKTGNPNGIDADGKVKDLNKLDILVKKQTVTNNIPKDGQYVSRVVFSLNPGDNKDYASFTPPDGSNTIIVEIDTDKDKTDSVRRNELMKKLKTAVKNAGWTNVTLWNKADNSSPPAQISNFDKTKEYTVRMIYDANGDEKKGVATVTLPDGKFIKVNGKTPNKALSNLKTQITNDNWSKINIDASKITGINKTIAHTDVPETTYPGLKTVNLTYETNIAGNRYLKALSFGGANKVYKYGNIFTGLNSDAIFVIDNIEYKINENGTDYDFENLQIKELNNTKTFSSLKLLIGKHFKGKGPLNDIKIIENDQRVIGIRISNEFVSLNEIMDERVKITKTGSSIQIQRN